MSKRILRLPEVEAKCGIKVSEIYQRVLLGTFPRQVPIGPKTVGWLESELDAWIDEQVRARDAKLAREHKPPGNEACAASNVEGAK